MSLPPGTRIGPYAVTAQIGVGGMGEVYRATDSRLGRDVAIKVLPTSVAQDAGRLARLDREARTLAALNHPNIAQIYGVEESPADAGHYGRRAGGEVAAGVGPPVRALIMELVEGPTLAERLSEVGRVPPRVPHGLEDGGIGPAGMPLDEALAIAKQIADALEAAHEQGIIHRDLKPANIKLRSDGMVKVLDFGLAKAFGPAESSVRLQPDFSQAPTITTPATEMGMILGTAAYMAPEQAAGKPVDKRADIWAFGVVLWEMLAGRRMFEGETVSHVLAAVLTKGPDLTAVSPRVRPLLARCLEKDPRKRLRDIGDAMSFVQGPAAAVSDAEAGSDSGSGGGSRSRTWLGVAGWAVAGVLATTLAAAVSLRPATSSDVDPAMVRFQIERTADIYNNTASAFAVSPNGLLLAHYDAGRDGQLALFVRTLATGDTREVPGSATATLRPSLFWSPDSRQIVFGTTSAAHVFDVSTDKARLLCGCRFVGGSWNEAGTILLGSVAEVREGIRRLSADGRTFVTVSSVDASKGEDDSWPSFLPDGRRFLFTRSTPGAGAATYVGTLDGGAAVRVADGSWRTFVTAADDREPHLLGIDTAGLVAQAFDPNSLSVIGAAVTVVPGAIAVSA